MLLSFIVLYLLVSIGVGLYAATRVHNTADYAVAGRSLPLDDPRMIQFKGSVQQLASLGLQPAA